MIVTLRVDDRSLSIDVSEAVIDKEGKDEAIKFATDRLLNNLLRSLNEL